MNRSTALLPLLYIENETELNVKQYYLWTLSTFVSVITKLLVFDAIGPC